jgi:hypothetical protein
MAGTAAPMNRPEPTGEQSEDAIRRRAEQNHEGERWHCQEGCAGQKFHHRCDPQKKAR